MDDDGDMAEMHLTDKKDKIDGDMAEMHISPDPNIEKEEITLPVVKWLSKSAPNSPAAPISPATPASGARKLQKAFSSITRSSRHASFTSSSSQGEDIVQLEMLLEAYFVFIDHTLSKLSSLKEYIDDTEDLINIKLGNVQNQLIQYELLLTAATFVATIFAVVAAVFWMNFQASIFNNPFAFNWVLLISGVSCGILYFGFLIYFRRKRVFCGVICAFLCLA
ncbi:hypothetical protein RND81_07G016900 [Saponaria officinalis]|uniref:Uncharacterized protein n=1 Tax=Saponaria officinalis TaxID=3572 RepID=A0AAW1JJX2_SAPOF